MSDDPVSPVTDARTSRVTSDDAADQAPLRPLTSSSPPLTEIDAAPAGLEAIPAAPAASRSLATSLVPVLQRDTELRLGDINWFRTDWQRGGAATGRSTWTLDDGDTVDVVVKLPVPHRELDWQKRLQIPIATEPAAAPDGSAYDGPVVPRLFAGGHAINGYDLAWIVMEALPHGPLGMKWSEDAVPRLADAVARFQAAAAEHPVDGAARREDWAEKIAHARDEVERHELDDRRRWRRLITGVSGQLDDLVARWRDRPVDGWIHGDAHLANAMMRSDRPGAPVCLIDLAEVRPGHWIEDAVLLERLMWARPERLEVAMPVPLIAQARRRHGLAVEADYEELAELRRLLMAATAPCFLRTEGHPRHLAACLDHGERALERLG